MKEWDQCVFKGSAKNSAAAELKKERRRKRAREGKFDAAGDNDEERVSEIHLCIIYVLINTIF